MGIVFRILATLPALGVGAADGQAPTVGVPAAGAVRVAESVEAGAVLARIAELEAQGRYVQAVREYEGLLSEHGEAVVRSANGGYAGVRSLVLRRWAAWPDQAKEVCRDLLESRAAAALAELDAGAGPWVVIREAERWWLTQSAADAALRCAKDLAANGCTETADWVFSRWSGAHPELADVIREPAAAGGHRTPPTSAPADGPGIGSQTAPEMAEDILWTVDLPGPTSPTTTQADEALVSSSSLPAGLLGRLAVLGDRLLVQDSSRLFCFGLYSGRVEWVAGERPEEARAAGVMPFDPAVGDELVFAVLPEVTDAAATQPAAGSRVIMAFEPDGGARWTMRAGGILGAEIEASFAGSPVAYEQGLFVAVAGRSAAIEDVYLVRLEPATGKVAWRTHLASWTEPADQRVAAEGGVRGRSVSASRPENVLSADCKTSVRRGDRLEVAERIRLTCGAGEIIVRSSIGIEAVVAAVTGGVERITVGVHPEVRTPGGAPAVDSIETGAVIVQSAVSERVREKPWERGTVPISQQALDVPDERNARSQPSSRRHEESPRASPAPSEDRLRTVLTAKVRGSKAAAVLERRLIEDPTDCDRWLDLAHWALGPADQADRGVSAMREALACAANATPAGSKPTIGTAQRTRRRVLDMAMEFGQDPALTKAMQAFAAEAAADVRDHVRYRLRFAELHERAGRWIEAAELLQGILDRDALRDRPLDDGWAGAIAADRLGSVIARQGRSAYAAIEAQAAGVVSEAMSRGDAGALEAAVRRYPNSRAVTEARMALAKAAREANRQRRAIRWLCEGAAWMDAVDRAAAKAQVAECYFELGAVTRGLASLARGANEFPDLKIAFAGTQTTFSEAYTAWRSYARTIPRPLPQVGEVVQPGFSLAMDKPFVLPPRPDADGGLAIRRFDLVLVETDATIRAIDATSGAIRWRTEWDGERAAAWLADDDDVLVLTSPTQVVAVDRGSGRHRWRWALSSRDADRARATLVDPEFLDTITAATAGDIMMVVASRSGRIAALRLNDGRALWRHRMESGVVHAIEVGDAEVACVVSAAGRQELVALNAADGSELARTPVTPSGRLHSLTTGADGSVIAADGREAVGYDPRTLEVAWRWPAPPEAAMAGLAVRGGDMFAYGVGFVAAITPEGRQRWVTGVGAGRPIRLVRATGGQVHAVGDDAMTVLDAATGMILRQVELRPAEVIEDWTLSPQYVAAVVSRPVNGAPAEPRALELVFLHRSAGSNGGAAAAKRVLLSEALPVDKVILTDGAVVVQSEKGLISWRCPTGGAGTSLPSN